MSRSGPQRALGMVAAVVFGLSSVFATAALVQATVPGTPGVPQSSTLVYQEDFQNRPAATPIVRLSGYTATDGGTYTAAGVWLSDCNGWIASSAQPVASAAQVADCADSQTNWNRVQQLSRAIGMFKGQTAAVAANNYALSAYTAGNPGVGAVEFRTVANRAFVAGNGRFITFAADVAAINCGVSAPLLQFQLINASGGFVNAGAQVDGCTNGTAVTVPAQGGVGAIAANVKTVTTTGSVLFTGSSIGVRMLNNNGSGAGNDHAVDNIRIIDASPQLDKVFSPTSVVAGNTSTLTLTVTNTSELAAKNGWSFTDALPAGLTIASAPTTTCPSGVTTGAVGGTSVGVTGNLSAGMASCTVTVNVTSPVAGSFTNGPANITSVGLNPPANTTVVFAARNPSISIQKSAEPSAAVDYTVGQTVAYSFVITNTGNVPLSNVAVNETEFTGSGAMSAVSCPSAQVATLAPGAQVTCTASYVITQADVDATELTNEATATGTPSVGGAVTSTPSAVTIPAEDPAPELTVVKSVTPATVSTAGETLTYSFLVTNTGNVTLTDIEIDEGSFSGSGSLSAITCPTGAASLAPSGEVICTATYVVSQADIDSGTLTNTATAIGTPPTGPDVESDPSDAEIDFPAAPALTVDKTADPGTAGEVGDEITYSFLVTNTGNVTITNVGIDEGTFTGTGPLSAITCPSGAASLAPLDQVTCTATYELTQADVDAGQVVNSATAVGTPPTGPDTISPPDEVIVDIPEDGSLAVVKTADADALAEIAVGQTVDYSFQVTNTGNVSLSDIAIDEGTFSGTGTLSAIVCPPGALAAGAQVTCTASYVVTQADVDAGQVSNTATAIGTTPAGSDVESDPSSEIVPASPPAPSLTIVKSALPAVVSAVGDEITYSFLVTNTGNVTLTDVAIDEGAFSGTGTLSTITCATGAASLAPGASVTCSATYVVTQDDVDSGEISNSATATATPPSGPDIDSPPDEVIVDVPADPELTVVKSADAAALESIVVGQTVNYSFLVTNSGNVTIDDVAIDEGSFSGSGSLSAIACPTGAGSLAPGDQVTCTATYVVTQADVDAGEVTNTATAVGTPPTGPDVESDPSDAVVPAGPPAPALTVVKTATPASASAVGDEISYSFLVTNTGNVTLTNVGIDEGAFSGSGSLSAITCPTGAATLAPGASVTCSATYELTQADVNSGEVTNSATAVGTPPSGPEIDSPPDDATVTIPDDPSLSVVKTATPATASEVGDEITYSFLVTNTGNVTLTDVAIDEGTFSGSGSLSAITCPTGADSLAPGESVTCTATYELTQADVNSGEVSNSATAVATPPSGPDIDSPPDDADVTIPADPSLTVVKTADDDSLEAIVVGQTVEYSFLVTNTGNVSLADIEIDEVAFSGTGSLSAITCPAGSASLAAGASVTCTATYVVTQADVDAEEITNSATASGTSPTGDDIGSDPSDAVVPAAPADPALTIVKTATPATAADAGDEITYSFVVTNTGNVTIRDVEIDEGSFSGSGSLSAVNCPSGVASLAPGATVTCTATYELTQDDVNSGTVTNSATAVGTPPTGPDVTSPPDDATVTIPDDPSLTVVKTATPATASEVGDEITYSFLVTNTGNVTLTEVAIDEGTFSGSGSLSAITCPAGADSLDPGESVTCTATYELTQADVNTGEVSNSATAVGTPPTGPEIDSPPDDVVVDIPADPSLTVVKTADDDSLEAIVLGQTVEYSFLVTNTGNVSLTGVAIDEGAFSGTGTLSAITCPAGAATLASGASVTCTATYVVTQADVDTGEVTNSATAVGTPPTGTEIESDPSDAVVPAAPPAPALTVVKSATPATASAVGDEITYSFLVTNTGNVTLTDVAIDEGTFSGSGSLSAITCPAGADSLAPGASVTCTATYELTQDDVDAGEISNSATAVGTPPSGPEIDSPPDEVDVIIPDDPSMTVVKTATPATASEVGDEITYSFLVTNTGNVTLTDIEIDEGPFSGTGSLSAIDCPSGADSLAPGDSVTCTATYELTQADVNSGEVSNSATAIGTPPSGPDIDSPPDDTDVTIPSDPSLSVFKTADDDALDEIALGQTVEYSFLVTNTGNVTLTDVAIDEGTFSGTGTLSAITCPAGASSLAAGATVTCTATYVVTQADVDAGEITNSATAVGTPPTGTEIDSDPSEAVVPAEDPDPSLSMVKSATPATASAVGDEITYSFLVTNTGNVTLTDVGIDEGTFSGTGSLSAITCPSGSASLAPGASVTCTATYVLTQADVNSGEVSNSAVAVGTPPTGPEIDSPPDDVDVVIPEDPSLDVEKTATPATASAVGDEITYSFLVTNTGNVTLTDIAIDEGAFSGTGSLSAIDCPSGTASLAPGASVTCTATYVLTQADVNSGEITNSAVAVGTPPTGPEIDSPPDEVDVTIPEAAAITVVKTAEGMSKDTLTLGETITYLFLVTNTGNVTLDDVTVVEGEFTGTGDLSDVTCPATRLAPGADFLCSATYVVTQADVDAGQIENVATVGGTTPSGGSSDSPPSEVAVPSAPEPGLAVVKTASVDEVKSAGDVITYTFTATNTGNVTLENVTIVEGVFSGSGKLSAIDCGEGAAKLAPGQQVVCTATYVVTQADLDAGTIANTATGVADTPDGTPVTSDPTSVDVTTPGSNLAFTGMDVGWMVVLATLLVLLGGVLVLIQIARRREAVI